MSEKRVIMVSEILAALAQGKTREDIKTEHGLSHREMQILFKHPKLRNKKTHKEINFELVDDTAAETPQESEPSAPPQVEVEEVQPDEVQVEQITEEPVFD